MNKQSMLTDFEVDYTPTWPELLDEDFGNNSSWMNRSIGYAIATSVSRKSSSQSLRYIPFEAHGVITLDEICAFGGDGDFPDPSTLEMVCERLYDDRHHGFDFSDIAGYLLSRWQSTAQFPRKIEVTFMRIEPLESMDHYIPYDSWPLGFEYEG